MIVKMYSGNISKCGETNACPYECSRCCIDGKREQIPQNRIQTVIDAQINPILAKTLYLTVRFQCLFVNHQHKHPFSGYNSRNGVQSARNHATIHVLHKDSGNRFMGSDRKLKKRFRNPFHSNGAQRLNPQTDLSAFCTKISSKIKNISTCIIIIREHPYNSNMGLLY